MVVSWCCGPSWRAMLGLVAALAVMGAALLLLQVMPESDQPWGDLGQIFLGILLAGVAGVVVWVVGLVRAARHLFASGRRLGVVIWSAFAILAVAVVLAIVGGLVDSDRLGDEAGRGLLGCGLVLILAARCGIFRPGPPARNSAFAALGHQKSTRVTTRRSVGRLTSANPASAHTASVPKWNSSEITFFVVMG